MEQCGPLLSVNGGAPLLFDLETCQQVRCAIECETAAVCAAYENPPEHPKCSACVEAECCDDAQLLATAEELGFRECVIECLPDWSCVRDCELAYPGGVAAWNDLFSCVVGPCSGVCTGGDYCGTIGLSGGDCTDCAVAKCCDAFEACSQDVACMDYFFCHLDCQDQDAFVACASLWPVDIVGLELVATNCMADQCAFRCGGGPAGCGLADGIDTQACGACIRTDCCTEGTGCGSDASCAALKVCSTFCEGNPLCEAACRSEFPAGVTGYEALVTCTDSSCPGACP